MPTGEADPKTEGEGKYTPWWGVVVVVLLVTAFFLVVAWVASRPPPASKPRPRRQPSTHRVQVVPQEVAEDLLSASNPVSSLGSRSQETG
jgi:hypothetical protein